MAVYTNLEKGLNRRLGKLDARSSIARRRGNVPEEPAAAAAAAEGPTPQRLHQRGPQAVPLGTADIQRSALGAGWARMLDDFPFFLFPLVHFETPAW